MSLIVRILPFRQVLHLIILTCPCILFQPLRAQSAEVRIEEDWITLSDGVKLAADWYLPAANAGHRLPIILEYLPYRKEESRRHRYGLFSYFVRSGYLVIRVDIRGTGNSEGQLIGYEYTDQEQKDALEVIKWLADHPLSSGQVVMMGISWGGFNALQVAMRKPPALKAIVSLMSTDDLYQDDVHYIDGIMHIDAYEIGQDLTNALPGAPDFILDSAYFSNRFDTYPWLLRYKKQQRDGPFWNRASLNENYQAIDVPVFAVGGLYDGYRDFIPRYFRHADVPVTAVIGPWNHTFPHWAEPPPVIEWRQLVVDWLDDWLKTEGNHISKQSTLFTFQRDWHPPGSELKEISGYWRQDSVWPSQVMEVDSLFLHPDRRLLVYPPGQKDLHLLTYQASVGVEASGSVMWWGDWAPDQSAVDQRSLSYESDPVSSDLEIFGFPSVVISTSVDAPLAHWVVRLSDVAPDGRVTQITGGALNGAHRRSAEEPLPIVMNEPMELPIEMHFTTWTIRKGHRIRLAINNAQWPMLWPTPYPLTMHIHLGFETKNLLLLPSRPKQSTPKITFGLPTEDPSLPGYQNLYTETNSGFAEINENTYDPSSQIAQVLASNKTEELYPWGKMIYIDEIRHQTNDSMPSQTQVTSVYTISAWLPERQLRWEGHLKFTSDQDFFYYLYTRKLYDNQSLIREKNWHEKIPRDHH